MLVFVVPSLVRLLIPSPPSLHYGYSEASARGLIERMESTLADMGIDSGECWRKGVCSVVNSAVENVALGRASSWDKIIDGITQNSWVNRIVPNSLLPTGCLSKTDNQQLFQCPIAFNRSTLINIISEIMKRLQNITMYNGT
ncbi:uncharacterized protein LOC111049160 [Nilaparvata lugens]|uniref:uncharacterized protein LOC111049160 n=1 Tax=Nilaparvata lugens TaxID=108931 RepID=UPI00193DE443|nr:uncharacterized protein LOC111049160 [Nilaparvata lugens]